MVPRAKKWKLNTMCLLASKLLRTFCLSSERLLDSNVLLIALNRLEASLNVFAKTFFAVTTNLMLLFDFQYKII